VEVTKALAALKPLYGKDNVEVITTDGQRIRGIVRSMKTTQALTTPSVKMECANGEIVKIPFPAIAEIRDHETAMVALQAAETGHLVFGTLHANSVAETPERLLKLLPADIRERARDVFATVLVALLSQVLIPKRESGRIALREILLNDDAITAVLKKGSDHELEHYMRSGRLRGMTNRKTHLQSIRSQIESHEYNRWMQVLRVSF